MRTFKYIKSTMLIVMILLTMSCEDYVGGDINSNPNSPTEVPVTVILPATQVFLADVTGGDFSRFASMLTQQTEGVARQWASLNNYSSFNPAALNTTWNNIYENILIEFVNMKGLAAEAGHNHYEAIANTLIAYTLLMSTDVWDAIPYAEAFQGIENISASFDDQTAIYNEVFSLLSDADGLFSSGDGGNPPGNDDVYYGGDIGLWVKTVSSLRARANLHLGNYSEVLTSLGSAYESADDNMGYQYPDVANAAQWYRFNRDRTGDIEFHPTMRTLMGSLNDTVRLAMFDATFVIDTHPYFIPDFFEELITFRELKFMEAEALLETGGSAAAIRDAYLAGIEASFDRLGVDGYDDYVSQASVDPGEGNISLEDIITQKYIGLFAQPEVYNDWRRTDFPTLTPTSGSNIPVRFPYGSDEILFNANAPSEQSVNVFTDKVGWDQ